MTADCKEMLKDLMILSDWVRKRQVKYNVNNCKARHNNLQRCALSCYCSGKRSWSDSGESSVNTSSEFIPVPESLGGAKTKWHRGHETCSCSPIIHHLPAPQVHVQFWSWCQKGRNRSEKMQRKATRVTETQTGSTLDKVGWNRGTWAPIKCT